MKENVLVVAAHPDDEVLGCGGTIAKFTNQGLKVNVLFLSDGVSSRFLSVSQCDDERARRKRSAERAAEILRVTSLTFLDYPDNCLDSIPLLDLVKNVELLVEKFAPRIVLTHHPFDLNIDHRQTNKATITACRPLPGSSVHTLLFFEVPSSTDWQIPVGENVFRPTWFEDISDFLAKKMCALECYKDEIRSWPHPRSRQAVERIAQVRGSNVGVDAAEAFTLGRLLAK